MIIALLLIPVLASCRQSQPEVTPTAANPDLPTPEQYVTRVPDPDAAARAYLEAWEKEDYPAMYALLSHASQAALTLEQFTQRHTDAANEMALADLSATINQKEIDGAASVVQIDVVFNSTIIGEIRRTNTMPLALEDGSWKVVWQDDIILPELAGGNFIRMDGPAPTRGAIYDRAGNPLAAQTTAAAVGVWPDYVSLKDDENLISLLAGVSNYRWDQIATRIENAPAGSYLPIAEVAVDAEPRRLDLLRSWGAAVVSEYTRRLYYGGGIGTHIVGYVSAIQQEEATQYRRKGYRPDERVGRKGLEFWGENILLGKRGGSLYVFSPDGRPVTELGSSPAQAGQDIYTTIERDFQREVQRAMSVYNGAIVVLERDTGRVLAMASSPNFDPNAYEIENYNWNTLISEIVNNPALPQFNRATQGQYPLGSVFKIITLAAALESGRFTPESSYDCQYSFTELGGITLYDWTWEHFQEDGETRPSGLLTLPQALIRSCNPWFWHIGRDLYDAGLTTAISDMSEGFGLGSKTGIEGVDEEAGNIPEPMSQLDATNLAIGQGDMLVTPLQVARFVAAVGNGGTLYRPQLIEKIAPPGGEPTRIFKPEAQGTLPVKPSTLALIQEAMKGVVASKQPVGTAYRPINGLDVSVAGKTGTAEVSTGDSHAWFAGYTFENNPNRPDIAIAVIAENSGEGSEIAAPIFRRVVELWFYGKPLKLYRWESAFDVTRAPTAEFTETPTMPPGTIINP